MARILLNTWPLQGPMNCMLNFARSLKACGHEVSFVGIADCKQLINESEFTLYPICEALFPEGSILKKIPELSTLSDVYSGIQEQKNAFIEYFDYMGNDGITEFKSLVDRVKPDLFLIEGTTETSVIWAMLAFTCSINAVYINTTFPFRKIKGRPPLDSLLIPNGKLSRTVIIELSWVRMWVLRYLKQYFIDARWNKLIKKFADKIGYPQINLDFKAFACPLAAIPEISTTPDYLDFPLDAIYEGTVGKLHNDTLVDAKNDDYQKSSQEMSAKKLIYCSLGTTTQLGNKDIFRRFYQTVIDAISKNKHWNLIISAGKYLSEDDFNNIPGNVQILSFAPQQDILSKANAAIVHGGVNSLKECIVHRVPMVIYPFRFDQPGSAARACFNGIALAGNIRSESSRGLIDKLVRIMDDPLIAQNIFSISNRYQNYHEECVERLKKSYLP